jgi:hypothetical protein
MKEASSQPRPIGAKPTYLDVPVQPLEFHKVDTPTTIRIKDIYQSVSPTHLLQAIRRIYSSTRSSVHSIKQNPGRTILTQSSLASIVASFASSLWRSYEFS